VTHAVFVFFAVVAVASAIFCVTQRNPVAAIMWLIVTMLSLAGIFVLLVMLLQLRHHESDIRGKLGWVLALGVAGALLMQLAALKGYTPGRVAEEVSRAPEMANPALILPQAAEVARSAAARGSVGAVAEPMFTRWLVPFELTSVLLLAAIVGAVVLAKRRL
jgi:NADH-quinone oxidoreductase subunit J